MHCSAAKALSPTWSSEHWVLFSMTVVWDEWAVRPLKAAGSDFYFPNNSETYLGLSRPFSFGPFRDEQFNANLRKERDEEGSSLLSRLTVQGLITASFGEVGRQEQHSLCWMEEGGGPAEGGMASGSISLGVRNDS